MNNRIHFAPKWISVMFLFLFVLCLTASAQQSGQNNDIVIDWESRSLEKPPPVTINHTEKRRMVIRNVNDILYTYHIEFTVTQPEFDGLAEILDSLKGSLPTTRAQSSAAGDAGRNAACDTAVALAKQRMEDVTNDISNSEALPFKLRTMTPPVRSVPLAETQSAWARIWDKVNRYRRDIDPARGCGDDAEIDAYYNLVNNLDARVNAKRSHEFVGPTITFSPGDTVEVKVFEFFEGRPTQDSPKTFTFATRSTILTLSGGVLISTVPNRSYEPRKVPGSTLSQLVVEGNSSFRPEGVMLLNYMIPYMDFADTGFALSGGPVVRFGSTGDTSALGFFAGISAHIHHQYYFTPGFHFGQFADFPAGFGDRSLVPEGFGEVNPIKRWTARFAFAFSYRTKSFKSTSSTQASNSSSGSSGGGSDTKTNHPARISSNARASLVAPEPLTTSAPAASPANTASQMARTVWLRKMQSAEGDYVTLHADARLTGYTTYSDGNLFYMVIPQTLLLANQDILRGRSFVDAEIDRSQDSVVLTFLLRPNTKPQVVEKFNRLEISFVPKQQ